MSTRKGPKYCLTIGAYFSTFLTSSSVFGQDMPNTEYMRFGIGLIGAYERNVYLGTSAEFNMLPLVQWEYKRFELDTTQLSYSLYRSDNLTIRPTIGLEFAGYQADDADILVGLDDRGIAVHAGIEWEAEFGMLEVEGNLLQDISGKSDGLTGELGAGIETTLGTNVFIGAGVGVSYYSDKFSHYYYGVTAADASDSRVAYQVGATINPFVEISFEYQLSDYWYFGALFEYAKFDSSISNSPLVDANNQIDTFVGVKYEFYR